MKNGWNSSKPALFFNRVAKRVLLAPLIGMHTLMR